MRRIARATLVNLLCTVLPLLGCADNAEPTSDGGVVNNHCAPGLKPMGLACVPIFDECGDDEVPMLGGGCKRVGVRECLNGWGIAGPPDWKCKPIGPPRTCLKGWEKVAGGWCEPILPKTKCPAGMMEKIGFSTCQPIGDCGSGTWGNIKTTASTIFVDQGHSGTGGKGTKSEPYKTIREALNRAVAGDRIAIATGTYSESVSIRRKVTLEGRCAQLVTIIKGSGYAAVELKDWANGAVLRGVTVTGGGIGLWIKGVIATVERVAVQGCEGEGIDVGSGGTLTLRDSLVAGNRTLGIALYSSQATVERTVVRDTRSRAGDGRFGEGLHAELDHKTANRSQLTLRDCVVTGNRKAGVYLYSSVGHLTGTVVSNNLEQTSDGKMGTGVYIGIYPGAKATPELALNGCFITGNRYCGVAIFGGNGKLERTVVRDTRETASGEGGGGIQATAGQGGAASSVLTVSDSLVTRNHLVGIAAGSAAVNLIRTVVSDTRAQRPGGLAGSGIAAESAKGVSSPPRVSVHRCIIAGNRTMGLAIKSGNASVTQTVIRDTRGRESDGDAGQGIYAAPDSPSDLPLEVTVQDCLLARNHYVGLSLFASRALASAFG